MPCQSGLIVFILCICPSAGKLGLEILTTVDTMEISFASHGFAPMTVKTWTLVDSSLVTPKGDRIPLHTITQASFIDERGKRTQWVTTLSLTTPDKSVKIFCSDQQKGEDRQCCFQLILAVLDSLQNCNPAVRIRLGHSPLCKGLFILRLVPALVFFVLLVVIGHQQLSQGISIIYILFAIYGLSGAVLVGKHAWLQSPFRRVRMLSPTDLQEFIRGQPNMTGLA